MTNNLTKLEQAHLHKKVEQFNLDNRRNRSRVRIKKYKPETYFAILTYLHIYIIITPTRDAKLFWVLGAGGILFNGRCEWGLIN